ncbi:MAG: adenosylmethionine---8-amino-7-oxononanoate aminotransferase, partial [Actinomycetota bacterium]|nr:adenosylmethionine---8-amino-7-oxononanoate aminotransferase [Actinomycetota bacterium]
MPSGERDEWARRDAAVVWHGFTPMDEYAGSGPVIVERGEGHELIDVDGNRYLDAISSLWVTTLGHRVPELDEALRDQLDRVAHSTMLGHGNRVVVELAEALALVVPVDDPHVLFAGDGASAVEQALKIAFQYWVNVGEPGRHRFLAFGGAYHGDTVGALSLGDGGLGADVFAPLRFPVLRAPGFDEDPDFKVAVDMVADHAGELAAVVVEPLVQGAAGIITAPDGHLRRIADIARRHGVLLVVDEVATGFGRTGKMFACEHEGVEPDLLCVAKGLTGGYLPLSATLATSAVFDAFLARPEEHRTLYHGHSYSGNPLCCAAALANLDVFEAEGVLAALPAKVAA